MLVGVDILAAKLPRALRYAGLGDVIGKSILIVGCLIAGQQWRSPSTVLGLAIIAGAVIRLCIQTAALPSWLLGFPRASNGREHGQARGLLFAMLPIATGALLAQIGDIGETALGSYLGSGALSLRAYARKIVDLQSSSSRMLSLR